MSHTVGYILENEAYKFLPGLLRRDFGIETEERLVRRYVRDSRGADIEVNIIGKARREDREVLIVGESKSQLSKNDIDRFVRKKLGRLEDTGSEMFPVLVTHMIAQPDAEEYAKEKGIAVYFSYDFTDRV